MKTGKEEGFPEEYSDFFILYYGTDPPQGNRG